MTPDEIEQHDKLRSAIHEAGHAVVALTHGVIVKAWLERSSTKDPRFEKTWIGHIQNVHGGFGETYKYVGIAGVVAECVSDEQEVSAEEIVEYWKEGHIMPSPSDLQGMPDSWRERLRVVAAVLNTIREKRAFLDSVVSELVEHNMVSADRMVMLAIPYFSKSDS